MSNIETSKQQAKLVEILQKGNEALKNLQILVSIDDVKKLMDDTAEAKAYQVSELLLFRWSTLPLRIEQLLV